MPSLQPAAVAYVNICLLVYTAAGAASMHTFSRIALLVALGATCACAIRAASSDPDHPAFGLAVMSAPLVAGAAFILVRGEPTSTGLLLAAATALAVVYSSTLPAITQQGPKAAPLAADLLWCAVSAGLFIIGITGLRTLSITTLITIWGATGLITVTAKAIGSRQPLTLAVLEQSRRALPNALTVRAVIPGSLLVVLALADAILGYDAAPLSIAFGLLTPSLLLTAVAIPPANHSPGGPRSTRDVSFAVSVIAISAIVVLAVEVIPYQIGARLFGTNFGIATPVIALLALALSVLACLGVILLRLRESSPGVVSLIAMGYLLVAVGGAAVAATITEDAVGIAIALVLATVFATALSWLWLRAQHSQQISGSAATLFLSHRAGWSTDRGPLPLDSALRVSSPASPYDALAGFAFLVLTAVGLPAIVIGLTGPAPDTAWLWPVPAALLAAIRLSWIVESRERRLFEMMFWIFSYSFLGLAPIAQLRDNVWPATVPRMDSSLVAAVSMLILVANVCFLGGATLERLQARIKSVVAPARSVDETALGPRFTISHTRLLIMTVGSIVLNAYYLSQVGVIQFLKSRDEAFDDYNVVWVPGTLGVMVRAATYMTLLVTLVALVRYRREATVALRAGFAVPASRMRLNAFLILVVALLAANSMNPISNARYQAGTAILSALAVMGFFATPRRFRISLTGFLLALLVIFPFADAFRSSRSLNLKANNPIESFLSPDYDSFAQIMNAFLIAGRDGIQIMHQLSGVPLFWVPRAIWPGKPVDTGIYIANLRGYGFTNLSAPFWGEVFLNGGWVLTVLAMFALGYGLHKWDSRIDRDLDTYGMPGILGSIYPFLLMIFLRGSLIQATPFFVFSAASAIFVISWRPINGAERRPKRKAPSRRTDREVAYAG